MVSSNVPDEASTSAAAAREALEELTGRLSPDSTPDTPDSLANGIKIVNGTTHHDTGSSVDSHQNGGLDRVTQLEAELQRTREERETYANQYRTLLSRIQTMKSTLGNKLKQDADELDRREQMIASLNLQTEDLQSTVRTLQSELVQSHEELERSSKELELMRNRTLEFEHASRESLMRERELREVREERERLRLENEDLERVLQHERVYNEDGREAAEGLRRELETERLARIRAEEELAKEAERSANLTGVLEDFQTGKDQELRRLVQETEARLDSVTQSLAEYKHRALQAELELESRASSSSHIEKIEADLKEKSTLIGKLRHQNVVQNEHLTEALRRLHKNSSDSNVDRRLVNNILLAFLSTPRADTKRFEMLTLLASILSWSDDERERAGLQRSITPSKTGARRNSAASEGASTMAETESFSNMWVEFLLKEAAQGQGAARPSDHNGPSSPRSPSSDLLTSLGGLGTKQRGASLGSLGNAMVSSPNLSMAMPPGGKRVKEEKERRLL